MAHGESHSNETYSSLEVDPNWMRSVNAPEVVSSRQNVGSAGLESLASNPNAYSKDPEAVDSTADIYPSDPEVFKHGKGNQGGLEPVVPPPSYDPKEAPIHLTHLIDEDDEKRHAPNGSKPERKQRLMIIGGIITAVVVLVIVLGATLGTVLSKKKNADLGASQGSGTSSPTSTNGVSNNSTGAMSGTATARSDYSYPTAVSLEYPHVEVFAVTPEKGTSWKMANSTAALTATSDSEWSPSGGSFKKFGSVVSDWTNSVTAIARDHDNIDVFAPAPVQVENSLYHMNHNRSYIWSPNEDEWDYRGGSMATSPSVVARTYTSMDVFALSLSNYQLVQLSYEDGFKGKIWSDWTAVTRGGSWLLYAPTAVSLSADRMDVFLVSKDDNKLYQKTWDGRQWQPSNGMNDLGGYCAGRPVAVSRDSGELDIFVRGGDAGLWHLSWTQNDGWSDWRSISGDTKIQAEPDAVVWSIFGLSNRIDVFAWGEDNTLLHKTYDAGTKTWTPENGFDTLGEGLTGPPKAVSDRSRAMHVFAYTADYHVGYKSFDNDTKNWSPSNGLLDLGAI